MDPYTMDPGWGPLLTAPGGGGGNEEKGEMEGSGLGQSTWGLGCAASLCL